MSFPLVASAVVVVSLVAVSARDTATTSRQQDPVFSARSELVVLQVRVEDRRGTPVTDLAADAFRVFEDGRPQVVQFFGPQDAPVTVGLIVDSSGSMSQVRDEVAAAAGAFVETSHPNDDVFALAFNERVWSALPRESPFTSDGATLGAALRAAIFAQGKTALYDAILAGLQYANKGQHERRVLVIVADGGDNASNITFDELLRRAEASDALLYTVNIADPLDPGRNPKRLRQLADASGGEAFNPRSSEEIVDVLRHIARDIRTLYTVGYVPAGAAGSGPFRRVRVEVTAPVKGLKVRTRDGYRTDED
jgi:VWFA-related protein